jgi:hypothetical protein
MGRLLRPAAEVVVAEVAALATEVVAEVVVAEVVVAGVVVAGVVAEVDAGAAAGPGTAADLSDGVRRPAPTTF